jgi:hypothetical protein
MCYNVYVNSGRKTAQTRKGICMKKSTMETLVAYLNDNDALPEVRKELEAELNKNAEKAEKNRQVYAEAHDVIMANMSLKPATAQEIYDCCKKDLSDGFSRSKVTYGLNNYWADEVIKDDSGKVATYRLKA